MNNAKLFEELYGPAIQNFTKKITRQFRSIAKQSNVNIIIVDKNTRIECKKKLIKDKNLSHKTYKFTYTLYIGYLEISTLHENNPDIDIFDCFMKIVTHEYLHVLLRHVDISFLDKVFEFSHGIFYTSEDLRSPFFVHRENNSYTEHVIEYKFVDPVLMNIAGDFQINSILNIRNPFLHPSDFGIAANLTCLDYYSLLYHLFVNDPDLNIIDFPLKGVQHSDYLRNFYYPICYEKLKEVILYLKSQQANLSENQTGENNSNNGNNDNNNGINVFGGDVLGQLDNINLPENKINFMFDIKKDIDYLANNKLKEFYYQNLPGKLPSNITRLMAAKTGIWKEFREILNFIKKKETDMKLSLINRVDDWHKFNNRRSSDLLYPGKTDVDKGKFLQKFAPSSVMFVDISASMSDVVEPLFTLCNLCLKKLNITLVFYDTEIKRVFHSKDTFEIEPFIAGGTHLYGAYNQYLKEYGSVNNVYVITDGFDLTLSRPDLYPLEGAKNVNIWKIRRNSISKMNYKK